MGHGTRVSGSGHCRPSVLLPRLFGEQNRLFARGPPVVSVSARCFRKIMVSDAPILKAPSDKREYEVVHLRNGLSALLIHDPEIKLASPSSIDPSEKNNDVASGSESDGYYTDDDENDDDDDEDESDEEEDEEEEAEEGHKISKHAKKHSGSGTMAPTKKAAAALCVSVGSFSDPKDAEGLAHFLEHMLFMGSSKFPDENEYDGFLAEHGGSSNAFTEMEFTCYHFDVHHRFLKPALDRFSQFFISPLVKVDSIEREVQAVDSEFVQALQNDSCRLAQLKCHTANPLHPYNRFSWGNAKSLNEAMTRCADIRQKLMDFYKKHYLAGRMKLVVLGGEPLETLKEWVLELFEEASEGSTEPPSFAWDEPVWDAAKIYRVESVKDQHRLSLTWVLPCLDGDYLKKPHDYISHLIGHEAAGSLLPFLKAKGWATDLSAGVGEDGFEKSTAGYLFSVKISLTISGLDKIYDIIGLFYEYIKMLSENKPQEWVFEEIRAVMAIDFRFAEEESADDYAVNLAKNMHLYPEQHIIYGDYAYEQWDPKLVEEVLGYINPSNMRIDVLTRSFDKNASDVLLEPWFGVPYTVDEIPQALLDSWADPVNVNPAFHLPAVNEFISRDFSIKESQDVNASPVILAEDPSMKVWYKLDQTFKTPRANIYVMITCKVDTLRAEVLAGLYVMLLKDALNEILYMANVANLSSSMSSSTYKIELKLYGYNEKLCVLARKISESLRTLVVGEDRFQVMKEQLERTYRNANMKPLTYSASLRVQILKKQCWSSEDRLHCLTSLCVQDVNDFIPQLFSEAHVEALCHGNLTKEEALDIVNTVKDSVLTKPIPEGARPKERMLKLPAKTDLLYNASVVNELEENSVTEMYFQVGLDMGAESVRERALVDLFEQLAYEPMFNQLRTNEQLGYRVDCGSRLTYGIVGFCFRIQSSKYSPIYIQKRIDAFIDGLQGLLKDMPEEVFQGYKNCLIAEKLEKDNCLSDETDRHWEHVLDRRYVFDEHKLEALALKDVKKNDMLKWYKNFVRAGGRMRRSLCIHVWGCKLKEDMKKNRKRKQSYEIIEDIEEFKNKTELYPPFP